MLSPAAVTLPFSAAAAAAAAAAGVGLSQAIGTTQVRLLLQERAVERELMNIIIIISIATWCMQRFRLVSSVFLKLQR
jgi:hypothetical protein